MRVGQAITLTPARRQNLESSARARSLPARLVERSRIVLLAAAGKQDLGIAAALGIGPKKAARWRARFLKKGLPGLAKDAPRPGRPQSIRTDQVSAIVRKTTQKKPANATHWSTRSMAAAAGVSEASVRRIWHAHGLKPHLVETFKIGNDPQFAEKLEAIVACT